MDEVLNHLHIINSDGVRQSIVKEHPILKLLKLMVTHRHKLSGVDCDEGLPWLNAPHSTWRHIIDHVLVHLEEQVTFDNFIVTDIIRMLCCLLPISRFVLHE